MSLYNLVHDFNPLAGVLLDGLNLYPPSDNIARFRDAALYNKDREENDYLIRVITRTGGPNRPTYQENIDKLSKHDLFVKDEDDVFDSTYAYFFFKLPESLIEDIRKVKETHPETISSVIDNKSMKEKYDDALKFKEKTLSGGK